MGSWCLALCSCFLYSLGWHRWQETASFCLCTSSAKWTPRSLVALCVHLSNQSHKKLTSQAWLVCLPLHAQDKKDAETYSSIVTIWGRDSSFPRTAGKPWGHGSVLSLDGGCWGYHCSYYQCFYFYFTLAQHLKPHNKLRISSRPLVSLWTHKSSYFLPLLKSCMNAELQLSMQSVSEILPKSDKSIWKTDLLKCLHRFNLLSDQIIWLSV